MLLVGQLPSSSTGCWSSTPSASSSTCSSSSTTISICSSLVHQGSHIVRKISECIVLDLEDEQLHLDSELTLKQEIAWASHLSLQACILPPPRKPSCANYARSSE